MEGYKVDEKAVEAVVCRNCPLKFVELPSGDSQGDEFCTVASPVFVYECGMICCKSREEYEVENCF